MKFWNIEQKAAGICCRFLFDDVMSSLIDMEKNQFEKFWISLT